MRGDQKKRRIGVLGGMGPEATVLFMSRVIALTDAKDDHDHVPLIVDNNTQVPSRIKALIEKTGEDPGPILASMAKRLEASGAEALAMPCNTAHHYASVIDGAVGIPLLNMIELSVERVLAVAGPKARVGLLASPAAIHTGIFDRAFAHAGIETIGVRNQERMLSAIRKIKIDSTSETARQTLYDAAVELTANESDVLVIACSEFSIIADTVRTDFRVIDTTEVLAESVVAFASDTQARRPTDMASPIRLAAAKG